MHHSKPLTAKFVKDITRPGRYTDGPTGLGLSLLVRVNEDTGKVTKFWSQRITIAHERVTLGLGSLRHFTLAEARQKARENARLVAHDGDPRKPPVPSYEEACLAYLETHKSEWTPDVKQNWRSTLLSERALKVMGKTRIDEVTSKQVLKVLKPVWTTKPTMAKRLRRRISSVMKSAIGEEYRKDNPASDALLEVLSRKKHIAVPHAALPHAEVGRVLREAEAAAQNESHFLALKLLALTVTRIGETVGAQWQEVDFAAAMWTIPTERMKAKREHTVPLSTAALDVLHRAKVLCGNSPYVFPGKRQGKPVSDESVRRLIKKIEPGTTLHGLRSSLTDWAAEEAKADKPLRNLALAHVNVDQVEAPYLRTTLPKQRAKLMQDWADYIS